MNHPLTDWSVDKFIEDWENTFGKGSKTNNIQYYGKRVVLSNFTRTYIKR